VPQEVTQKFRYWKADLQKFVFPASEFVLEDLPDEHYSAWMTLVRLTELVYNTGRKGFSAISIF